MGGGGSMVSHLFNQKKSEQKLVEFVIIDEMSFRMVEGKGFLNLMHEIQPLFKVPNRRKVASSVYDLYMLEKAKLASFLRGHRVSITTDTWTSIQNINYMVVTAHFMDNEWNLRKRILNFVKITGHKGDDIGRCLESCLRYWGIQKLFSIIVDNASANDTAIDYIRRRFKHQNTLLFDGKYLHLRCSCHIINLIVKDGLKELSSSIKAIRNVVQFIHTSPSRLHKFRGFAILEKFDKMSTVPMDVKTRWNSTYKMIDVAFKYRRVFERMGEECMSFIKYFEEKDEKNMKRVGPPCDTDWDNSIAFSYFLMKFYGGTLILSATKTPTSNLIFDCLVVILIEIDKKMNDESDPILKGVALSIRLKFDKYWGSFEDLNPLIFVANVLDPRNKLRVISVCLRKTRVNQDGKSFFVSMIKQYLLSLWNEYRGGEVHESLNSSSSTMQVATHGSGVGLLAEIYGDVEQDKEEDKLYETSNEVDKYLSDPFESRNNQTIFNLMEWWKGSELRYPILSEIAKDVFAVPSSTVASESAFSLGNRVVDPFRSLLSPQMVEALVCTNDWLSPEDFSIYKYLTDEAIELYKEVEEVERSATILQSSTTTV